LYDLNTTTLVAIGHGWSSDGIYMKKMEKTSMRSQQRPQDAILFEDGGCLFKSKLNRKEIKVTIRHQRPAFA
jgi:hypothetical protein